MIEIETIFWNLFLDTKEEPVMQFRRIRDLREDHDLTQQQVADKLCCQREVYRRYEKGIREIPVSYAIILAKYYGVTLDYLLEVSDSKN